MFETTIAGSLPKPFWLADPEKLWPETNTPAKDFVQRRGARRPHPQTVRFMYGEDAAE